jgi:hypothetical protein
MVFRNGISLSQYRKIQKCNVMRHISEGSGAHSDLSESIRHHQKGGGNDFELLLVICMKTNNIYFTGLSLFAAVGLYGHFQ